MWLVDHRIVPFLIFWGNSMLYIVAVPVYTPINSILVFPFFQYLPILVFWLLLEAILTGERWYLTVTFTYIFLVISDIERLFIYLLATFMSSLEKCLFGSFAQILIWLLFAVDCVSPYAFWILTPCWMHCLWASSPIFFRLLFHFVYCFICCKIKNF